MNQKNLLIASIAINVMLIVLIFVVKKNAQGQAQEFVKRTQETTSYQIAQVKDNIENNNLLWTLIDSTWKSSDKSIASVKKMVAAQKLPRCKGKPCEGDEARLNVNQSGKELRIGWAKYSFKIIYDNKDKFVTIDASDLLGKSQPEDAAGEEEAGE